MSRTGRFGLALAVVFGVVAAACTSGSSTASSVTSGGSHAPVTLTVWDYYGKATPLQDSVIQGFEQQYPWITVDHQALGWNATHDKFTVTVSSGEPPDVATMDMTWMPTFASNGLFADLGQLSGGQLNVHPIEIQYNHVSLFSM
jgi:multiple sugar transport system substrate-binding protein